MVDPNSRRLENLPTNIRLGMMRHTFVVVDMSKSMGEQDLKPTRFKCCLKLLQRFIDEYFDQNPIRCVILSYRLNDILSCCSASLGQGMG